MEIAYEMQSVVVDSNKPTSSVKAKQSQFGILGPVV